MWIPQTPSISGISGRDVRNHEVLATDKYCETLIHYPEKGRNHVRHCCTS